MNSKEDAATIARWRFLLALLPDLVARDFRKAELWASKKLNAKDLELWASNKVKHLKDS